MHRAFTVLVCCSVVTTGCVYNTFERVDSSAAGSSASGGIGAQGGTGTSAAGNSTNNGGTTSSGGQPAAGQPGVGGNTTVAGSPATNGGATAASGGSTTNGGTATAAGRPATNGGSSATFGGTTATGGKAPTGGSPAANGGTAAGGVTGLGGIAPTSGGTSAIGGSAATGGRATGGSVATGGSIAVAGSAGVGASDPGIRVSTKIQALPASSSDYKNSVTFSLRICNVGSDSVSLANARLAYWYSIDGAGATQIASVPYTTLTGVTVAAIAVDPMRGTTDAELEVTLPAGTVVASGACLDELQVSVHAGTTWVVGYDLTNDWSYLATTTFANNNHVTVYLGTKLIWGIEPPF